jgi:integrase
MFCCYLSRSRPGIFIPNIRTFPKELPHKAPYLLSESEVARVLSATKALRCTRRNQLHSQTIRLAFLLLFCCGLRKSEVLKLRLADVDMNTMALRITETKFHKSRLIPVSASVAKELRQYPSTTPLLRLLQILLHTLLHTVHTCVLRVAVLSQCFDRIFTVQVANEPE